MYQLLIVDDEYEIRHGISSYFPWDELGFHVAGEAENGLEALNFIRGHAVDVILCDIKMPVKSGLELAKDLKAIGDPTRIVFLTGHKEFELIKEALVYGARDYIVKPTKYQELAQVFQKLKIELDQERQSKPVHEDDQDSDIMIRKMKDYVKEHFQTVQLKDVSRIVHMNLYYISTYFKKKTGQSFSDYVLSVKMEKAAQYLSDPQYKTYEVSELVGYGNPKNFSKAFKAFYGRNPRQFRSGQ
ncbi:response regulator [Paenibacillus sepulcri]|uniref:Response regulator n=1 Tax=Paenibacillus sepulcri TaxID=359917 RepID=A0ABS7C0H2_9BACL|nr:response regulator [Paenibacillus sepulcri]